MSMPYELEGRVQQKQRTRDALVAAARELIDGGHSPTVEEAAAAAQISRTTAYRYFSSQRQLMSAAHPETSLTSLLPDQSPGDVLQRVELALHAFTSLIAETEVQQRTMLRLSLEMTDEERLELPLRQGRAISWFEDALAPIRGELGAAKTRKLAIALRSVAGIESLVWLRDVAGLSAKEAIKVQRANARAIMHMTLTEDGLGAP